MLFLLSHRSSRSLLAAATIAIATAAQSQAITFSPVITVDPATAPAVQQQQRDATNAALANLATYFQPSAITLRVEFIFRNLGRDGTLGQAGPSAFRAINGIFYAQGLYNFLTRTDLVGTGIVLSVEMNTNASVSWDYSNTTPPPGQYSWQDVIMHEVGHSMGFFDTVNKNGSYSEAGPSIFETLSFYNGAALSTYAQATRAQALISNNVFWNGFYGRAANGNSPIKNAAEANEIINTGAAPTEDREAAMVVTLDAGKNYTAVLKGVNGAVGIGVVEVYDLSVNNGRDLANIATRGQVLQDDQILIAGFIVQGLNSQSIAVRGIGPSLTAAGVSGALLDPTLEVRNEQGTLIRGNDNWHDDAAQATALQQAGLAPTRDEEAAVIITAAPGSYTAQLRGKNNSTGVGLVEVYNLGSSSAVTPSSALAPMPKTGARPAPAPLNPAGLRW